MKTLKYIITAAFLVAALAGCQSQPRKDASLEIYSPAGPVVAAIEADIAANRLTRPTGNNALEKIHRLSLIAPGDARIEQYKDEVAVQLVKLGQQAFLDKKYERARLLALRALKISPETPEAGFILDAVTEARKPTGRRTTPSETIVIEEVEAPESVGIITVTVPSLESTTLTTEQPVAEN
ncbi:hypothetical protein [Parendozoicomonas haliclonae]|nr:hypothetical protein [Parendozoicomonas haliclonae]